MVEDSPIQRIDRLMPLDEVLMLIAGRVHAVAPRPCVLSAAHGRVLAEAVVAAALPPQAIALRDGYAVEAGATADAGSYSPLPLSPQPRRIEIGEPLPEGTDAVLPLDLVRQESGKAEALGAVVPGDGALAAGGDVSPHRPLLREGAALREIDNAVLAATGIDAALVREPHIRIVCGSAARTRVIDAGLGFLARVIAASGAAAIGPAGDRLDDALQRDDADAVFVVGGTGSGARDRSVRALAQHGRVATHGIALSPGETTATGFANGRPVLLIPGRLDAVVAVWLLIGRPIVDRLAGAATINLPSLVSLKRKVTSTIGLTQLIPVDCSSGMAEPLASGYLSLAGLARSDGWIVVPAESEGFAAGAQVAVRPWP